MILASRVAECGRLIRSHLGRRCLAHDLNESQLWVLWACYARPDDEISQASLGTELARSSAHVSGLLEQLRKKGLLESRRRSNNRRVQWWRLTELGRLTLQAVLDDLGRDADRLLRSLPPETVERLPEALRALADALGASPDASDHSAANDRSGGAAA